MGNDLCRLACLVSLGPLSGGARKSRGRRGWCVAWGREVAFGGVGERPFAAPMRKIGRQTALYRAVFSRGPSALPTPRSDKQTAARNSTASAISCPGRIVAAAERRAQVDRRRRGTRADLCRRHHRGGLPYGPGELARHLLRAFRWHRTGGLPARRRSNDRGRSGRIAAASQTAETGLDHRAARSHRAPPCRSRASTAEMAAIVPSDLVGTAADSSRLHTQQRARPARGRRAAPESRPLLSNAPRQHGWRQPSRTLGACASSHSLSLPSRRFA